MGNRPILAGTPTIEVNLCDWEAAQRLAGRMDAAIDYIRHFKEAGGYLPHDAAYVILTLLGAKSNEIVKKINETEETEVETE